MRHLLLVLFCLSLAGCLGSGKYQRVHYYDLPVPNLEASQTTSPVQKMLHITRFGVLGPYGVKMVSRITTQQVAFDEYHRWAERPDDLVSRQVYLYFQQSGRFAHVTPPHGETGDLTLSGDILRFEQLPDGSALVVMEVSLTDLDSKVLHNTTYRQTVPAKARTGAAFAAAVHDALNAILKQALEDVAAAAN